jgi:hypothetical protein
MKDYMMMGYWHWNGYIECRNVPVGTWMKIHQN